MSATMQCRPEIVGIPCAQQAPHMPHNWQMSATGYCGCPGVLDSHSSDEEQR